MTVEPATKKVLILCDFDGTVSIKDTVNHLVRSHLKDPAWRFHVKRYYREEIGSRDVYEAVGPLMRMTREDLDTFVLNHAELDPHFPEFLQWTRTRGIDVKIVSDGFDATILTLFRNHGISGLEIFANRLEMKSDGRVSITSPHADGECGRCGTCKLKVLRSFRNRYDTIILVGDGESDRHAASEADMVLALRDLFAYCARHGIPAVRVDGFRDVPRLLTRRVDAVTYDMDGTLIDSLDAITSAFNHMFARLGYPTMTAHQVARTTGFSLRDFTRRYLRPEEAEPGVKIFRDYYDGIFLDKVSLMPGVLETLQTLDGRTIQGVVTNKRGEYARRLAEHLGFAHRMARIIGAEDGFVAKPAGEMFEAFMNEVGTGPEQTVYVGDAPIDIEAASAAGIDAFALAGPIYSAEELALHGPRRVLTSIRELPHAIRPILP